MVSTAWASLIGLAIALVQVAALADQLTGRVVAVLDGDAVDVLTEEKSLRRVRICGIDAPERRQPFGDASKRRMSGLVYLEPVVVLYRKTDRYGRIVGAVRQDGMDVGLALIQQGLAWHYKAYQSEQTLIDRFLYGRAERQARSDRKGLWSQPESIAPWEFRRSGRAQISD